MAKGNGGRNPPWSVKAFWLFAVVTALIAAAIGVRDGRVAGALFVVAVVVVMATLVYRGSRVAWTISAGAPIVGLALGGISPQGWATVSAEVVSVLLLVVPPSFRYIWIELKSSDKGFTLRDRSPFVGNDDAVVPESAPAARLTAFDPRVFPDDERPSGWYIDPDSPGRMRYWQDEGGWTSSTRTPRVLRKTWHEEVGMVEEKRE